MAGVMRLEGAKGTLLSSRPSVTEKSHRCCIIDRCCVVRSGSAATKARGKKKTKRKMMMMMKRAYTRRTPL
jgi:hypothetical protein